jgi:hypothetical protein
MLPERAIFDREVLAFNEPPATQLVEKGFIPRTRSQATKAIGPPRLLRQRSERPCDTRAHERDKLAPPHRFPRAETLFCLVG